MCVIQGAGRLTCCCDADWLATALVRFQFETLDSCSANRSFLPARYHHHHHYHLKYIIIIIIIIFQFETLDSCSAKLFTWNISSSSSSSSSLRPLTPVHQIGAFYLKDILIITSPDRYHHHHHHPVWDPWLFSGNGSVLPERNHHHHHHLKDIIIIQFENFLFSGNESFLREKYHHHHLKDIIIIIMSWNWANCWPVPVSRIQKSLQRSTMIPSVSWTVVFHYPA